MRELLFRGKRIETGEWVEGLPCPDFKGGVGAIQAIFSGYIYDVIPESVGQYTGLTDKNDKKIFEGDIVRDLKLYLCFELEFELGYINKEEHEAYRKNARTNIVSFCDVGSCGCCYEDFIGSGFAAFGVDLNECEVIGNIHDNPELLKSGAE